jgi:hypothetical protein
MSTTNQHGPTPQQPSRGGGNVLLIVLLSVGIASMLCCAGVCGGLSFVIYRTPKALAKVKAAIEEKMPAPLVAPNWANDWMAMEMLARAYTASLDAVAADKQVIERLGQPIEPVDESDQLFRRERKGNVTAEDETIEYEITGPKEKATVRVVSNMAARAPVSPYSPQGFQPKRITVTFSDGSELELKPLNEKTEPQP